MWVVFIAIVSRERGDGQRAEQGSERLFVVLVRSVVGHNEDTLSERASDCRRQSASAESARAKMFGSLFGANCKLLRRARSIEAAIVALTAEGSNISFEWRYRTRDTHEQSRRLARG